MKRKVWITVSAKARYEDGKKEKTLYTAAGTMEDIPMGWRFTYAEPEESGMAGTATLVEVAGRSVELIRLGTVRNHLSFSPGQAFESLYETPYGKMNMEVHTGSVRSRFTNGGGLLELDYELTAGGVRSERTLSLRVRPEESK